MGNTIRSYVGTSYIAEECATPPRLGIKGPILAGGHFFFFSSLVRKELNANFDGDQMAGHVPLSL